MSSVATQHVRIPLRWPEAGTVTSAVIWWPQVDPGAPGAVLAHGAGSDRTQPVLRAIAAGIAQRGHPVALFNFAYAQAGRRRPDPMTRLETTYRDVLAHLRGLLGGRPLVIGGRSLGGRVASHLAAQGEPCAGLCLLGYPLHPAGRPDRLRTAHWPLLTGPILFVSGDRDRLCDLDLLERERRAGLARADHDVHVVRAADHGFEVRVRDGRSAGAVQAEIVAAVTGWMATRLRAGATARGPQRR